MLTNRPIPNCTVIPELAYADVAAAVDFAGREWVFSQSIADVAPEAWGGTTA